MIKSIVGTIGSRFGIMFLTFFVVLLNTNFLGAEGQGTAALINLGIMFIVAINNYIGGGAVVYLVPRNDPKKLWGPALVWTSIVVVLFYFIYNLVPSVPQEFVLDVCILGGIQSLFIFNLQVLMGKQKIKAYNICVTLQATALLIPILLLYSMTEYRSIEGYVYGLYCSFLFTLLISLFFIRKYIGIPSFKNFKIHFLEMFKYGKYAQSGNVLQIMNYRLNFFLLESLVPNSRGLVGIFSIGMHMSEGVWNIGKSLSIVQYAKISNTEDQSQTRSLTLSFLKVSLVVSLIVLIIVILIPDNIYGFVFGKTITGLQMIMLALAPGILANACSVIFSHHFSGKGKHHYNTIASGLAFIITITFGIWLIPEFQIKGAAITASSAYIVQCLFLTILFKIKEKVKLPEMIPDKSDLLKVWSIFRKKSK